MSWIVRNLWLIPVLPMLAAGVSALMKRRQGRISASLAITAMAASLALSVAACAHALHAGLGAGYGVAHEVVNIRWFAIGDSWVRLGWVLDPLSAVMLVMVTFVGLLIFIYSTGYMAQDENFGRFFCFLSLFAGAMLGVVIANSLLLLFICWELVGLTSYLLIGFWFHRPSAAAAAKKAFLTTRIGDLLLLLGMVWLYAQTGTLLFYDAGAGCLEGSAISALAAQMTGVGMAVSTGIGLLIFGGAVGKSGQVPLHVWLPDAMEGPTPVSALIHAATMVAAGVFLVARVYPLMAATASGPVLGEAAIATTALKVVTWVGAITAVFAASIAVAQNDIKRILAYSTVSQLGYMMMGLGVGGVAVGMFHLITHAFFKALLFLGAGSVIHGVHEEQDIRHMGGLRRVMPVTFATYAVGMLALSGFPLFFSGFWSKDAILHAAAGWGVSRVPFYLGATGALLTAFYMTRQVCYVFFGRTRMSGAEKHWNPLTPRHDASHPEHGLAMHESPRVMTVPLMILAVCAVLLGFLGTPAWPWFQSFLNGDHAAVGWAGFREHGVLPLMLTSSLIVFAGLGLGWLLYGRRPVESAADGDVLERRAPRLFALLEGAYFVDGLYRETFVRATRGLAMASAWADRHIWNGAVRAVSYAVLGLSWVNRGIDAGVVNGGFDGGCREVRRGSGWLARLQSGRAQRYLRVLALGMVVLVLMLAWSGGR